MAGPGGEAKRAWTSRLASPFLVTFDRLTAAWRVVWHFHAVQARGRRGAVFLVVPETGEEVGRIDRVEIADGQMRVVGCLTGRVLFLATERSQSVILPDPAPGGAREFEVRMEGALRLTWSNGDMARSQAIRLHRLPGAMLNALRTLRALLGFAVGNRVDILRFFALGDSAAGMRLERGLLPLPEAPPVPRVSRALFGKGALTGSRPRADVIVPVHNAFEDLKLCLARLAAHTGPQDGILVIDDASTDPRVRPFLRQWAAQTPQAELLENDTNMGFVHTVNRGLARCCGHVVLLNTDAFVPEGWLDRLLAPFDQSADVASVTPLSNNAEIMSAPVICRAVPLAPGEAGAMDAAVARLDRLAACAEVPTGVGFCMALSRRWLDVVPEFDPAFGRGYGEEVDWCRRTAALGARHVVQGALFVEHRSGQSFGSAKADLVREGNRMISARYPGYDRMVELFQEADPAAGPRLVCTIAWLAQTGRVPVYLGHGLGGGAADWLDREVAERIEAGRGAVVARATAENDTLRLEVHTAHGVTRARIETAAIGDFLATAPACDVIYSNLVGAPDPLDVLRHLRRALRPEDSLEAVIHDYFPLCPSYNLLNVEGVYCGLPEAQTCAKCYGRLPPHGWLAPDSVDAWREPWRELFLRAARIVVFSPSGRDLLTRVWPDLADRIVLRPHQPMVHPGALRPPRTARFTLGVLGNIGYSKGAAVLQMLARHTSPDFRIVIIGKLAPEHADPRLVVHGPYDREKIADLARSYEIGSWFIPSIWPETFSFALHECLATGLPVFGFDIGGQGDALRQAPNGYLLPFEPDRLTPQDFRLPAPSAPAGPSTAAP